MAVHTNKMYKQNWTPSWP